VPPPCWAYDTIGTTSAFSPRCAPVIVLNGSSTLSTRSPPPKIPEGAAANTVVGIVNVKYETNLTMTNTAGGRFKMGRRLSGSTAEVLVAEVPTDYETSTSHQIEIIESRSDLAITSRATSLTISISDVSPEPVPEHAVVTAYKQARTVPPLGSAIQRSQHVHSCD